jgi:hypothetical protein
MSYFVVCGRKDNPLYECELNLKTEQKHLLQFAILSSLDCIDNASIKYLKVIDKYNDYLISCYAIPTGCKLLLLHEKPLDLSKLFSEVHELYIKVY